MVVLLLRVVRCETAELQLCQRCRPVTLPRPMFDSSIPWVAERIHAAAVSCSDGRWGEHVDEFLQQGLALPRYDRLAIPGGAGSLAGHLATWKEEQALVHQLELLVE